MGLPGVLPLPDPVKTAGTEPVALPPAVYCFQGLPLFPERDVSNRTITLDDKLYRYMLDNSLRENDIQRQLRRETMQLEEASMQIAPEQGQFMGLLVELTGARRIIEVGTFTGYSALSMALSMPKDGRLVCCDISDEWTAIARRYWRLAGIDDRIELRLAPALDTLAGLLDEFGSGSFDLMFIDADKTNYPNYYELALNLVRRGGLIIFDNTLWGGAVADPDAQDQDTVAIRELNRQLHHDPGITLSLLPLGDGLTLARVR